jgi:hypothetical protein
LPGGLAWFAPALSRRSTRPVILAVAGANLSMGASGLASCRATAMADLDPPALWVTALAGGAVGVAALGLPAAAAAGRPEGRAAGS